MKILKNRRILVCGKGGSGKSSVVSLLGKSLLKNGYRVILLDADASNPGGLFRLLSDKKDVPEPLIEFFGGREKVTCPSDDPSPMTRINSNLPINETVIDLSEIPLMERSPNLISLPSIEKSISDFIIWGLSSLILK